MAVDLAVFDLDGTLLRGSTVCEVLAAPIGRLEEMAAIEGDVPMLRVVGLPIFVGGDRPADLPASDVHLPHADIRDVAEVILAA